MSPTRRLSLVAGVLFLVTFVSSIAGALLYGPILGDPASATGPGVDAAVTAGALCELVLVVANLGTAIALFPVLKRQSEALSLAYVVARIMECVFIVVGILSLLTVVGLRQSGDAALQPVSRSLVELHAQTFLLGPGFVVGLGNGLLLGYLFFASGLMPPPLALIGMLGGPLVTLSGVATMFGLWEQSSVVSGALTLPEIVWEASLGIYLTFHGFRRAGLRPAEPAVSAAPGALGAKA